MVFIYHVLPCSESTGGFWHAGGDSEKRQCSQKATGCTLSPCSEDVTIDFLYLRKIINSVPLSLAVSYSAHPAGKCCSRAGQRNCLMGSITFKTQGKGAALPLSAVLHPTTVSLSLSPSTPALQSIACLRRGTKGGKWGCSSHQHWSCLHSFLALQLPKVSLCWDYFALWFCLQLVLDL